MAGTSWALHASNWAAFNLFTAPTIVQYIQSLVKPNGAKGVCPYMGAQPFQYCSFARWTVSIWPIQLKEPKNHFNCAAVKHFPPEKFHIREKRRKIWKAFCKILFFSLYWQATSRAIKCCYAAEQLTTLFLTMVYIFQLLVYSTTVGKSLIEET